MGLGHMGTYGIHVCVSRAYGINFLVGICIHVCVGDSIQGRICGFRAYEAPMAFMYVCHMA